MPPTTPQTAKPITLHPRPQLPIFSSSSSQATTNPLPPLLQTPSGLALLELQGTINLPSPPPHPVQGPPVSDPTLTTAPLAPSNPPIIPIGRLHFPEYRPDGQGQGQGQGGDDTAWMKRVYLYVGAHQRLQGQVQKLPRAVAVVRKRRCLTGDEGRQMGDGEGKEGEGEEEEEGSEQLEVVELVKWKVVFSARPEPVGSAE